MNSTLKTLGVAALLGAGSIAVAQTTTGTTNSPNGSNPSSIGGLPVTGTTPGSAGMDRTMSTNMDPNPSNATSSTSSTGDQGTMSSSSSDRGTSSKSKSKRPRR